jgi:N-formylglutamate amidohydrolase
VRGTKYKSKKTSLHSQEIPVPVSVPHQGNLIQNDMINKEFSPHHSIEMAELLC